MGGDHDGRGCRGIMMVGGGWGSWLQGVGGDHDGRGWVRKMLRSSPPTLGDFKLQLSSTWIL